MLPALIQLPMDLFEHFGKLSLRLVPSIAITSIDIPEINCCSSKEIDKMIQPSSFPDIFDNIFSRLDVESLSNAALVCKSWSDFIAASPTIMKQMCLVIDASTDYSMGNLMAVLQKSQRNFKSIKIKSFIALRWRSEVKSLMEMFQWDSINLDTQLVAFPELEPSCLNNLTSLTIRTLEMSHVVDLLKKSKNLKQLNLIVSCNNKVDWDMMVRSQSFQLESLTLCFNSFGSTPYNARGADNFLATQACCLKKLDVQGISLKKDTLEIITQMPKLESFVIRRVYFDIEWKTIELRGMKSLKKLALIDDCIAMQRMVNVFIKSAGNLEYLEVPSLDKDQIELAGSLMALEELRTNELKYYGDMSGPDLFPELRRIRVKNPIARSHQNDIALKVEEELTNYQLCLYEETSRKPHVNFANPLALAETVLW